MVSSRGKKGSTMPKSELTRRYLLQSVAGAAVGVPLLAACAPQLPGASPTRPAAGTASGATGDAVFPTYVPTSSGPKPDFPASGPTYDDAFNSYPANPTKALPADPPGTGGTVHIM